jgi:hypothetical protein
VPSVQLIYLLTKPQTPDAGLRYEKVSRCLTRYYLPRFNDCLNEPDHPGVIGGPFAGAIAHIDGHWQALVEFIRLSPNSFLA